MTRVGVWTIGARGNIATTAMIGAHALAADEIEPTGLVTAREPCSRLDLPAIDGFVFGGHEVRNGSVAETAQQLADAGAVPHGLFETIETELTDIDERIRPGTALNGGKTIEEFAKDDISEEADSLADVADRLHNDLVNFEREHDLDALVVVNVASTEPPVADPDRWETQAAFEQALSDDDSDLPASSLYAYAALIEGYPYVNFTPSTGSSLGGLRELAERTGVPHMGNDGKTGESLVKAALGPMFSSRNLRVRSWEGHNILGNLDGNVLESEENKAGKIDSKGDILDGILDEPFHNRVRIDYTPSLDDWKTAWDYIHFEGFLGTEMRMQFTWEGADSALAAPLVLDLVRLLVHADRADESGLQTHLASFFKAPLDVDEHALSRQFDMLHDYADRWAEADESTRPRSEPPRRSG